MTAAALFGFALAPSFGFIAAASSLALLPYFLLGYALLLLVCSETLTSMIGQRSQTAREG